jgi:hypothetical protein
MLRRRRHRACLPFVDAWGIRQPAGAHLCAAERAGTAVERAIAEFGTPAEVARAYRENLGAAGLACGGANRPASMAFAASAAPASLPKVAREPGGKRNRGARLSRRGLLSEVAHVVAIALVCFPK